MKIGAENRKAVITLAILAAVAIPLVLYQFRDVFFGPSTAAPPPSRPPAQSAQAKALPALAQDGSDPRLRLDILDHSRKIKYETGGRNIFTMEAPRIEAVAGNVRAAQNMQPFGPMPPPTPTPVPPPPPIPIKYYGFANKSAEPRKVFLQQPGVEQIFVAGQGDIVARRYRVIQITQNSVTMEDVLTGSRQPIPLERERPR